MKLLILFLDGRMVYATNKLEKCASQILSTLSVPVTRFPYKTIIHEWLVATYFLGGYLMPLCLPIIRFPLLSRHRALPKRY